MPECVLDASAVLAFLRTEPGSDVVAAHLRRSCLSAVNLSEVLEKVRFHALGVQRVLPLLKNWQVEIVPFDSRQAELSARIKRKVGNASVSLADRACLSLAKMLSIPAVPADWLWDLLALDTEIIQTRGRAQ